MVFWDRKALFVFYGIASMEYCREHFSILDFKSKYSYIRKSGTIIWTGRWRNSMVDWFIVGGSYG